MPVSLIIPIKGAFDPDHLGRALAALKGLDGEVVVATENEVEPAYGTVLALLHRQPDAPLQVVLSGACPDGLNGKVHNLVVATAAARGEVLLFMDADVLVSARMVREALALLEVAGVGAVCAVPYYAAAQTLGGALVAAYINTRTSPALARDAARSRLGFCAGAFYGLTRATFHRIGGFEPLVRALTDDIYVGRAVVRDGQRIGLLPTPAVMAPDELPVAQAIRHLGRWYLMGRVFSTRAFRRQLVTAQGPPALLAALLAWPALGPAALALPLAIAMYLVAIYRATDWAMLDRPLPFRHQAMAVLLDFSFPLLWLHVVATRRMAWRGRTYLLDHRGEIIGMAH
ncbi:MAG TPA: glycosyltransferase [bacterium]|nr:glycosyltransferase [bacterium]